MASHTTSLSATLSFVKKYPITLCGISLLFMPSVHRLLLFFTPLILSTAIFIVAMISWGPKNSSERNYTKRNLLKMDDEWTTNGLKDEVLGRPFELESMGSTGSSVEPDDPDLKVEPEPDLKLEPDPDLHHVESAPNDLHAEMDVEPDPDLRAELIEHVEPHVEQHVEPDPDLHVEPHLHVEPDPDLHVEHVGPALHEELHVEPDPDLVGEDKTSGVAPGHHNVKKTVLFSADPKLAKAVQRELAGLEASLSSGLNTISSGSSMEDKTHVRDKVDQISEPSSRKVVFPHQKAVLQALQAAA